jgi:hypothetical protein
MNYKIPEDAMKNYQKIYELKENEDVNTVIDIKQWLTRLGLSKYYQNFKNEKVYSLEDIKDVTENKLGKTFKINKLGDQNLIMEMLKGRKDLKKDFNLVSRVDILLKEIFGDEIDQKWITNFTDQISSDKYSGFQIKNFFRGFFKY